MSGMPHVQALLALNRVHPQIYAGTVPDAVVAARRAKNKRARAARRAARLLTRRSR